ncbi:MAG: hypothetical protein ACI89L_000520 [Phycisphaerales bacterium]|jgi:hypothetical protein
MGWTDRKPFTRAGQLRLIAVLCAAVFALCARAVWNQSTLLAFARGKSTLAAALAPDGEPVPQRLDPAAAALGIDFSGFQAPSFWLTENDPSTWTLSNTSPASTETETNEKPRTMGPFRVTIWTSPAMGLWASTTSRLDHKLIWMGDEQHGYAMREIRQIIASQWTTGGRRAVEAFATANEQTASVAPRPIGWGLNAFSLGSLLGTLGLGFASVLVSQRKSEHTSTTAITSPEPGSQSPRRSAA